MGPLTWPVFPNCALGVESTSGNEMTGGVMDRRRI